MPGAELRLLLINNLVMLHLPAELHQSVVLPHQFAVDLLQLRLGRLGGNNSPPQPSVKPSPTFVLSMLCRTECNSLLALSTDHMFV